jgi:hypothetical protein
MTSPVTSLSAEQKAPLKRGQPSKIIPIPARSNGGGFHRLTFYSSCQMWMSATCAASINAFRTAFIQTRRRRSLGRTLNTQLELRSLLLVSRPLLQRAGGIHRRTDLLVANGGSRHSSTSLNFRVRHRSFTPRCDIAHFTRASSIPPRWLLR